jgi:antitoxin HigA-1
MSTRKLAPLHPGEVLREEFMEPLGLTAYKLAAICRLPRTRIERIANEKTGITADTALRLAKALRTTPEFWVNLQKRYELETTRPAIAKELARIEAREQAQASAA